MDMIPCFD